MREHPSYRPAKPGKVTKLNPEFARLVQGPVRKPRAIARIERTAQLTYFASTLAGSAEAGR